jgi:hypothetical protein
MPRVAPPGWADTQMRVCGRIDPVAKIGETECALARGLEVVARMGVGMTPLTCQRSPAAEFLRCWRGLGSKRPVMAALP